MNFLDALHLLLWSIPPVGASFLYFRLAWARERPLPCTSKNLLGYTWVTLVISVVFAAAALVDAMLFHARATSAYLGLEFPKPPGLFAIIAATCAITSALCALHAAAVALSRGRQER
jgi:hypothetical protein